MTLASIHEVDDHGRPKCWNWVLRQIRQYVEDRHRSFVIDSDHGKRLGVSLGQVERVKKLILFCLDRKEVFAHDSKGTNKYPLDKCEYVHLYECTKYPITDVFTAFGWYVTVTDPRPLAEGIKNILYEQYKTIVLFSRLLYNIATELGSPQFCPVMTHMFLSVDYEVVALGIGPIDLKTATTTQNFALSSSLPFDPEERKLKDTATRKRAEVLMEGFHPLTAHIRDFAGHQNQIGSCAETLNILSFARSSQATRQSLPKRRVLVFGAAVRMKMMDRDFAGFDKFLKDNVAVPPCATCCHLFKVLGINFFDMSRLTIHGRSLPKNYIVDKNWNISVVCECCFEPFPLETCKRCPDCDATWCDIDLESDSLCWAEGRIYEHNCTAGDPNSPGGQTQDSEASQSQAPSSTGSGNVPPRMASATSGLLSQIAGMQLQQQTQHMQQSASQAGQDVHTTNLYHLTPGSSFPLEQPQEQFGRPRLQGSGAGSQIPPNVAGSAFAAPQVGQTQMSVPGRSSWNTSSGANSIQPSSVSNAGAVDSWTRSGQFAGNNVLPPATVAHKPMQNWHANPQAGTSASAPRTFVDANPTAGVPAVSPRASGRSNVPRQSAPPGHSQGIPQVVRSASSSTAFIPMPAPTSMRRTADPQPQSAWQSNSRPSHLDDTTSMFTEQSHQRSQGTLVNQDFGRTPEGHRGPPPPSSSYAAYTSPDTLPLNVYPPATEGARMESQTTAPGTGAYKRHRTAAEIVAGTGPAPRSSRTSAPIAGSSKATSNPSVSSRTLNIAAVPGRPKEEARVQNYEELQKKWHEVNLESGKFSFNERLKKDTSRGGS